MKCAGYGNAKKIWLSKSLTVSLHYAMLVYSK